jgi:hypothetical protein
MRTLVVFVLAFLVNCTSMSIHRSAGYEGDTTGTRAVTGPLRTPSSYDVSQSADPSDLSFSELKAILEDKRFNRIDDLLSYLYQAKPDYMSHYTLGFKSLSLHESSKENPRAIVFGKAGRFMITFNGERSQKGYDLLEVVEFNSQDKVFEYREIQFNDLRQLPIGQPYQISKVGGPEGKCLECHSHSRPIWESYSVWPGFYGGDDDIPIGAMSKGPAFEHSHQESVQADWNRFEQQYSHQGRYRSLRPMATSVIFSSDYGARPNADLSAVMTKMNIDRIARILKKKTHPIFRFAYLYVGACFGRLKENNRNAGFLKGQTNAPVEVPISPAILSLTEKASNRLNEAVISHQASRALRLFQDLGEDEQAFRAEYLQEYASRGQQFPGNENSDLLSFLRILLGAHVFGSFGTGAEVPFNALVAVTEKYFPGAAPETWPTALYEGIHRYDSGTGDETTWLKEALLTELFSDNERAKFLQWERQDWKGFCRSLEDRFPPQLKY